MTDATLTRRPAADVPMPVRLAAIATGFAVLGFLLRFLAFRLALPDAAPEAFLQRLCRWDCQWYVHLAEVGYDGFPTPKLVNAGNWAFFPLYPMLVGALRAITGLPTLLIAAGCGTLLSIGAALIAWPLLGRRMEAFTLFAAFLLCGPFSIYFTTFFSETLFMLLTLAVFAALKARRILLAGALAGALSATRIVGVFIVFAILWEVWVAHREAGGTWRNFVPEVLRRPDWLLSFALAPLGLFAYMLFLHLQIGDALAFQHVQRAWARPTGLPPVFIWNGLANVPTTGFWPSASQWLADAALLGYALTVGLFRSGRTSMGIYSAIALTLPLFAGLASMIRFVSGLAPMALLLSDLASRRKSTYALALAVLVAGAWFGTLAWLGGNIALV